MKQKQIKKLVYPLPKSGMTRDEVEVMYNNFYHDMCNKINEIIDRINNDPKTMAC